jgi:hypothetical protein
MKDELRLTVAKHQAIVTAGFIIPLVVFGMALKRGMKAWSDPRKKKLVYISCLSGIFCSLSGGLYSLSFVATELEWIDHDNIFFYMTMWALYLLFLAIFYITSYQLRRCRLQLAQNSSRWTNALIIANRIEIMVQMLLVSIRKFFILMKRGCIHCLSHHEPSN